MNGAVKKGGPKSTPKPSLSAVEFIVLIAIMFSMIALGTDTMLPSFPQIADDLGLTDVNKAQLVISVFVMGTGIGQLITGPLSDSLGRKPVILGGLLVFMAACVLAVYAQSLTALLVARFIQGMGVSAPRTVTIAMIRDLYTGRQMARVMSLSMAFFVLVPAVAPLIGQSLAGAFGWRSIFVGFILFAVVGFLWMSLRQPETHPVERRGPIRANSYLTAMIEVFSSRIVITYTLSLGFAFGALFAYLSSAQQIFVDTYHSGSNFPLYFAGIALLSGAAGVMNAILVVRFGMRAITTWSFGVMFVITALFALLILYSGFSNPTMFALFLIWSVVAFFIPSLTFGNLNTLSMEPMGHIAGMASAIIGAISTLFGVLVAIPIGLAFDGTALPLVIGCTLAALASFVLMLLNPKANAPASDG